jgi:hypothetical protein
VDPLKSKFTLLLLLLVSQVVLAPFLVRGVYGDVIVDIEDFVDNDTSNVDSSADIGSSSDFSAQQSAPDSVYDTLSESVPGGEIEDYVDLDTSDVDSSPDKGTHSNFNNEKSSDSTYDTLTEEDTDPPTNSTAFSDDFELQNFNKWDQHLATSWQIGTIGSGTGGSMNPHGGSYDAWADETNDGQLISDSIDLSGSVTAYYSLWMATDDLESTNLVLDFYNGSWYTIWSYVKGTDVDDTWVEHSGELDAGYLTSDFRMRLTATIGKNENAWLDDVVITKTKGTTNHQNDLEVQFTSVATTYDVTDLAIKAGTTGAENLGVSVWNGAGWDSLAADITQNGWTNITVTSYVGSTMTFRFLGGSETGDTSQDTWEIDAVLLNQRNGYELDLEVQWTVADFDEVNEYLCIHGGAMGAENIGVDIWHSSTWNSLLSDLSAGWNNVSVAAYLDSSTFTIRFKGGSEVSDPTQDTWQIDSTLLHVWTYNYERAPNETLSDLTAVPLATISTATYQSLITKANAVRTLIFGRLTTQLVDGSASTSRFGTIFRIASEDTLVSALAQASMTILKSVQQPLSVLTEPLRIRTVIRSTTERLSLSSLTQSALTLSRSTAQAIGIFFDIARSWTVIRSAFEPLQITAQSSRTLTAMRQFSQALSIQSQQARIWTAMRSNSQALFVNSVTVSTMTFLKSVQQSLGVIADVIRQWTASRTHSQPLTLATQISRAWTATRSSSQSLTLNTLIQTTGTFIKSIQQTLTAVAQTARQLTISRAITQPLDALPSILRAWTSSRSAFQPVQLTAQTSRQLTASRTFSQAFPKIGPAISRCDSGRHKAVDRIEDSLADNTDTNRDHEGMDGFAADHPVPPAYRPDDPRMECESSLLSDVGAVPPSPETTGRD